MLLRGMISFTHSLTYCMVRYITRCSKNKRQRLNVTLSCVQCQKNCAALQKQHTTSKRKKLEKITGTNLHFKVYLTPREICSNRLNLFVFRHRGTHSSSRST